MAPLGDIVQQHNIKFHFYADDTELYFSFKPNDSTSEAAALSSMQNCIADIKIWMTKNMLKLNDEKTEFILIGHPKQRCKVLNHSIKIGDHTIRSSQEVKNLGVIFDSGLNMDAHITKICKTANFHLCRIGSIRKYLTKEAAATLVHAFISSRLDCGNSLLQGITKSQLSRLQRVQNCAARLVSRTRKYDHITPVMKDLHWLPLR